MTSLNLIFLWHMHQPDYRDDKTGEFRLPWVYLHATKDYTDMAAHLEAHPRIKAVVNFVPILLDQIEDYAAQFAGGQMRDPLLRLLAAPDLNQITAIERERVFEQCFRSNRATMIKPYPAYTHLLEMYHLLEAKGGTSLDYFSGQYLADLLVWYHLVWIGESVRRSHELVARLMAKGSGFAYAERAELFELIGGLMQDLIPRYRKLAASGQIELSTTPHYHPLAPLLINFASARDSMPTAVLPEQPGYPGGRGRVAAQLQAAVASHMRRFGEPPAGVWPAEGAVSQATMEVLAEQGCRWSASGEGVLANSLYLSAPDAPALSPPLPNEERARYLYRPYRLPGCGDMLCFFRDEKLSDLIGFEYAKWFGRDAARHFTGALQDIARAAPPGQTLAQLPAQLPVVSVILDGENAWEYYPYNGYHFLNDLYESLEQHPAISTTTYREYCDAVNAATERETGVSVLPKLAAGSWVYGTFSTWIGEPDKNRAWDLLCAAKQSYDMVMQSSRLSADEKIAAERQLSACESSDWFWWLGAYNPPHAVASFDKLFRVNLANLYGMLKLPVPAAVLQPISQGGGHPEAGGAMRRSEDRGQRTEDR